MLKAINIKWDTDGDKKVFNELPTGMIIPDELENMLLKKFLIGYQMRQDFAMTDLKLRR